MSDELKPCPFCGSPAIKRWAMIHCSVCPAMMQNQHADEAAHVKAWNRRAALSGDVRPDAKPDEDGDCTVCGLPWPDEQETLEPHVCPPGFLSGDVRVPAARGEA